MKHISNCPICFGKTFSKELSCKDHTYSKKEFQIESCNSCGFWFTNPVPEPEKIGAYYKSDEYVSHTKTKKGLINFVYHIVKTYAIKQKFKLVKPYFSSSASLLDYGCGAGDFLAYCNSKNVLVKGYEPSEEARKVAVENSKSNVCHTNEIHNEKHSFDVITMWHVLEHVYDLNADFKQLVSLLKNDGRLVIAVPNRESFDANNYGEYWAAYDLPRHLYHFSKKDIKTFAKKHDLMIEKIIPMVFDSFYVSMLSEKYKNGNLLSGVFTGLKSNLFGRKNAEPNHSSLIYILKTTK